MRKDNGKEEKTVGEGERRDRDVEKEGLSGSEEKKGGKGVRGREGDIESRMEERKHEGKGKEKRQSSSVFLSPAVTD